MKALGMVEVYSFTVALCAADIAAKTADVKIIAFDRNRPLSADVPAPLIMALKMEGDVAAVRASVEAAVEYAKSKNCYVVSHIIARPDDDTEKMGYLLDINKDKFNKKLPKNMRGYEIRTENALPAIGILEVQGLVASIEGLDNMLKAASVRLIHTEKRLGGRLVTLIVKGAISDVNAAIAAGASAAGQIGKVYGCEAIARPHAEIMKYFDLEVDEEQKA